MAFLFFLSSLDSFVPIYCINSLARNSSAVMIRSVVKRPYPVRDLKVIPVGHC